MHTDGAVPHAEELRHLARLHPRPVPEYDRLALAHWEMAEGTKDLLSIQRPADLVWSGPLWYSPDELPAPDPPGTQAPT